MGVSPSEKRSRGSGLEPFMGSRAWLHRPLYPEEQAVNVEPALPTLQRPGTHLGALETHLLRRRFWERPGTPHSSPAPTGRGAAPGTAV